MTAEIWNSLNVPTNRGDHLIHMKVLGDGVANVYKLMLEHLEGIPERGITDLGGLKRHFEEYDDIKSRIDRCLLNLFVYTNKIKISFMGKNLETSQSMVLNELLAMIAEHRKHLTSVDYFDFMATLSVSKNKDPEIFDIMKNLAEKRLIKNMLNGLLVMDMILHYVTTFLKRHDILDSYSSDRSFGASGLYQ